MEKWYIVNHGFIPKGRYYTKLEHGESRGLIIYLEDDDYLISLDFGAAIAFHCIDEGNVFFSPYDKKEDTFYQKRHYEDILYRIENSAYQKFIFQRAQPLYQQEELHHYLIVTLDYFIDVITSGHIDICVEILKTHEKKYLIVT